MSKWVYLVFISFHVSFDLWGVCNAFNRTLFNASIYALLTYVMIEQYRKTKDIIYFFFAGFWIYYLIVELWIGLK